MGGAKALAKYHYQEGVGAIGGLLRDINGHSSEMFIPALLEYLKSYGTAARVAIPDIKALIVIVQTGEMTDHPVNKKKIAQCEEAIRPSKRERSSRASQHQDGYHVHHENNRRNPHHPHCSPAALLRPGGIRRHPEPSALRISRRSIGHRCGEAALELGHGIRSSRRAADGLSNSGCLNAGTSYQGIGRPLGQRQGGERPERSSRICRQAFGVANALPLEGPGVGQGRNPIRMERPGQVVHGASAGGGLGRSRLDRAGH